MTRDPKKTIMDELRDERAQDPELAELYQRELAKLAEVNQKAIQLLRQSPTRQAVMDHRYWPWRRRVEAFLRTLDEA